MSAINAPFAVGTLVAAGRKSDGCHVCRSTNLRFVQGMDAQMGLFECVNAHEGEPPYARYYVRVTAEQTPPPWGVLARLLLETALRQFQRNLDAIPQAEAAAAALRAEAGEMPESELSELWDDLDGNLDDEAADELDRITSGGAS